MFVVLDFRLNAFKLEKTLHKISEILKNVENFGEEINGVRL